jgi:hypothetical protein
VTFISRPGHPTYLDDDLIAKILEAIPQVMIMKHVASILCIPYQTFHTWMTRGGSDIREGLHDSIFAKLHAAYYRKRSEVMREKLEVLSLCPKNYGAITWILEKCFKDDFEVMSESHKQLLDWVENYVKPLLAKGGFEHGVQETKEGRQETEEAEVQS